MGRLKNLFRGKEKSDGSPSANPYDQGPPVDQQSPPPNYDGNQFFSQGSPRNNTRESTGTNPPQYSPGPPGYGSTRPSPNPSSSSPNFPTNARYPTEKSGASDGVGANRYDNSTARQYGQHAAASPKYQGGYGGLNTQGGNSLPAWPAPQRQTATSSYAQAGVSDGADGYAERPPMTEEEMEQALYDEKDREITHVLKDSKDTSSRSAAMVMDMQQRVGELNSTLFRQGDHLDNVENKMIITGSQAQKGEHQMRVLDKAGKMMQFVANSNSSIRAQEGKKIAMDRNCEVELEDVAKEREAERQKVYQIGRGFQAQPKPLLGGNAKKDFALEENEEQVALNESIESDLALISSGLHGVQHELAIQGAELERQQLQLGRIHERVDRNQDHLRKNNAHMQTQYLSK